MRLSSSLLLLSSIFSVSFCDENTVQINSASELIAFSNNVSSGTDYAGTTVLLTADIDFSELSEQFTPIGSSASAMFHGIFDGQGHTISNLAIRSSALQYVGLFGYSNNMTIQNVVIDNTCSFTSSYSSGAPFVGSIIGYSPASNGPCVTTNIVNMASVSFKGDVSTNLYIGGIIGSLRSSSYSSIIRNCVNYGTVTHSGACNNLAYIGGIAGYINRTSPSSSSSLLILMTILPPPSPSTSPYNYIQNCANYGTIIHSSTSTGTHYIGGIAGFCYNSSIGNCVSSGVISTNHGSDYIGTIVGGISEYAEITHSYWTSDVGFSSICGYKDPIITTLNVERSSLNQTTVDELNERVKQDNTWSKWFMVHLNGGRINNITQESLVEIQGHFPNPVKEGNTLLFWCKDAECTEVFDPKKDSVSGITDIYAKWDTSTTIKYVVAFDFDNGTTVNETFSYNALIEYPKNIKKEGYVFSGWNNYHEYMPAKNITVTAQWKEIPTQYVEIVFSTKDMTEEEVSNIVKKYVNPSDFTIIKVEASGDSGETRVIIKFNNAEKAENFVEIIKESDGTKNVGFISEDDILSFTVTYCPMALLSIFIWL